MHSNKPKKGSLAKSPPKQPQKRRLLQDRQHSMHLPLHHSSIRATHTKPFQSPSRSRARPVFTPRELHSVAKHLTSLLQSPLPPHKHPIRVFRRQLQIKWTPAEEMDPKRRQAASAGPSEPTQEQFDPKFNPIRPSAESQSHGRPRHHDMNPPQQPPQRPQSPQAKNVPPPQGGPHLSRREHAMHRPTGAPADFNESLAIEPQAIVVDGDTVYPRWKIYPPKEPFDHYDTQPIHDHKLPEYAHRGIFEQLPTPPPIQRKSLLESQLSMKERLEGLQTLSKKQERQNITQPPYSPKSELPSDLRKSKEELTYQQKYLREDLKDPTFQRPDHKHTPTVPNQQAFVWGNRPYEPPAPPNFGLRELHPINPPSKPIYPQPPGPSQEQLKDASTYAAGAKRMDTEEYVEKIRSRLRNLERTQKSTISPTVNITPDPRGPRDQRPNFNEEMKKAEQAKAEKVEFAKKQQKMEQLAKQGPPSGTTTTRDTLQSPYDMARSDAMKQQQQAQVRKKKVDQTNPQQGKFGFSEHGLDDTSDIDFGEIPADAYKVKPTTPTDNTDNSVKIEPIMSKVHPFDNQDVIDRIGDVIRSKIDLKGSQDFLKNRQEKRNGKRNILGLSGGSGGNNGGDGDTPGSSPRFHSDDDDNDDESGEDSMSAQMREMREALNDDDSDDPFSTSPNNKRSSDTRKAQINVPRNKKMFPGQDTDNDLSTALEDLYDPQHSISRIHELLDSNRDLLQGLEDDPDEFEKKRHIIDEIQSLVMREAEEQAEESHQRNLKKIHAKMKKSGPDGTSAEKVFGPGDRHWKRNTSHKQSTSHDYSEDPEYLRAKLRQEYQDELRKAIKQLNNEDDSGDKNNGPPGALKTRPDDSDGDENIEESLEEDMDERQLRLMYGNRVNKTQYMLSKIQSETLFITHKNDFFQGISPRVDYRPSKQALEFAQKVKQMQFEFAQRRLRDPTFLIPTTEELIEDGILVPPLVDVDDEFSPGAIAQTYNNIRVYETYLSSLQPRFLPTCNVFAMHTLLTREMQAQLDKQAPPSEPPSAFSPQTLLPNIYSPLDIQYRPLFADFLLAVRYELKVRNNLPFANETQRTEERLVYEKHFFKVEYQSYKRLYQNKLKEQLQANPARAYLWDLNEFTLGVAYNELIKQKQKLINDYNENAKKLGERTIDELDMTIVEAFVMKDEDYAISTRLFRLYRQAFETNEQHMKESAIGHKHSIIRQQAEFNQYLQWFSDDVKNNNPFHTHFFQKDKQNRELNRLKDLNSRLKRFMPNDKMKRFADADLEDDIQRILEQSESPQKQLQSRQLQVTKNLRQLPSRYDIVLAPIGKKTIVTKEDKALEILQDQSVPLLQRQVMYLERIGEIKKRRELKALRRQKTRFSIVTSKFDSLIQRITGREGGLKGTDDQFADLSSDTDYEQIEPTEEEKLKQPQEAVILDDFFPGLREFVALDMEQKASNLLSFPELVLIDSNEEYLKQYQYLAQQATKNNKALTDTADTIRDYDKNDVEIGHKYSKIIKNDVLGKDGQPNLKALDTLDSDIIPTLPPPSKRDQLQDESDSDGSNNSENQDEPVRDPTESLPDHLRRPQDVDQRLTQQLYQHMHFTDEFIAGVRHRLEFEKKERFSYLARDSASKAERKYEKSIRKYLRKKFPMLTDGDALQRRIEEEKQFDKQQAELVKSFDFQLNSALEQDIVKRQEQTDRVRKYQLQKALAITNKELDNYNRQEQQLLREIEQQKSSFLDNIREIYHRNLDTLYTNIRNRDKNERETILNSFNQKMLPFVERYKELERHLFESERKVLIKHYNQQRFEALYQKDAAFQLDSDPSFNQLEEALSRDNEYQYHRTFRPEYLDLEPIRADGEGSIDPNPNIGATNDPNSPADTRPTADYKIDIGEQALAEERKQGKSPTFAEIDPFANPFKGISIGSEPDFLNLPKQQADNILRNSLGVPHANEAVQALYNVRGTTHTKLHAYYAFLGYDPANRSIDDIIHHLSRLFGRDSLARAVEYAKILATDEVVLRLHTYRPKHEFEERQAVLHREINELRSIIQEMNPELFKEEGERPDGWGAYVLTLPYINYRTRYFEVRQLLADKLQEMAALTKYIQHHGLESEPLDKPHFDDFRTLFDAFSLAEQRKVRTFMHPYKRDGIFEVTPLSTDLPRRRIAFATHQGDLPEGYVMQDVFHGISDWDDFMQRRDQLFLDIRGTTATMKELEAQLKHYCIAVVEPTLEHFIDVFLSTSSTTNHKLRRALDMERSTLNMDVLRDYKKTKFLQEMAQMNQNPALTGSLGDIYNSGLDNEQLYDARGKALHPALQSVQRLRDGPGLSVDPNFINLNALKLDKNSTEPLSAQIIKQQQAAMLRPDQQWRSDNALQKQWNQYSQDTGLNGGLVDTYPRSLPEGNRSPESYRNFAFSRLFLPHYMSTTDKTVIEQDGAQITVHDLEVVESKKPNIFSKIFNFGGKKPTQQSQTEQTDPEFEEFLRIQNRQFTEEDKLRALRDKDFVINNVQAMRKELLNLDTQLEELYLEIQRTLPDELNFIYTPIDINLSYTKLEIMLDTPILRRPSYNQNTWDDRTLENRENITQHQINRILQDPFLNIDTVNDTISRYIMMGKVISEQEGKRKFREHLLEDQLIVDELQADDDLPSTELITQNSNHSQDLAEMYSNFQSIQPRSLRLLRQQENLENKQIMTINSSFDKLDTEMKQQLATVEAGILMQLKKRFPSLPIPQLITEYNNKLHHVLAASNKEIITLKQTESEPPLSEQDQLSQLQAQASKLQSKPSPLSQKLTLVSDTLQKIAAPLYKSRLPAQNNNLSSLNPPAQSTTSSDSPQNNQQPHTASPDPSSLTPDQEYEVYTKLLRYAREQTDQLYQKQYPNMSKLDRLKLNPVNVPKRVNPAIPDVSAIYQKAIDEHQLTMWSYVQRRNRAQALIQERLLVVLPPFKTKADVRLHMLSLPHFISRDDLMEDPTQDLEYYVNYYNSLPHKIETIEKRLELIPVMPEFITFQGRVQILESVIEKRHGHNPDQHRQFLQNAMNELEKIKPDIVREFERLPSLLEQYQEEYDGNDIKAKVAELSQKRKDYLAQIDRYTHQETERIRLEHLATEYHSIAAMIESEYLLQLNLLFEQSLVSKDKQFLQHYQTARNDFNNILASLKNNPKQTRGFYDKLDIISQTQQWCVNQTYTGPTIKKFLRHPDVAREYQLRERRKEKLEKMNSELKSAKNFVDEVDYPYDTRHERRKQDVKKTLSAKRKKGIKDDFDLGDDDSDHDMEVLFSSKDKSPHNNEELVKRGLKRRGKDATQPHHELNFSPRESAEIDRVLDANFHQLSQMDLEEPEELAFDDFDSALLQQLVDESDLHVQYVDEEPPVDSKGNPLPWILLPHTNPNPGLEDGKSLYVQLKQHNTIARLLNNQYEIVQSLPDGDKRFVQESKRGTSFNISPSTLLTNMKQMLTNTPRNAVITGPTPQEIFSNQFKTSRLGSLLSHSQPSSSPPSTQQSFYRIPIFSVDELLVAKKLDRMQSAINIFTQFHTLYCYPDIIAARRRVFDPATNTAYLITNPHALDKQRVLTNQEKGNAENPTTSDIINVLTGESKVFSDLASTALLDLDDRHVLPEIHAALRHQLRQAMQLYNSHLSQHGKPPEGVDPQSVLNAEKWLANDSAKPSSKTGDSVLNPLDSRYRRTTFDPTKFSAIRADYFDWRQEIEELNLSLMDEYETLQFRQYEFDLYNAECEEAVDLYRKLKVYPHLRQAVIEEAAQLTGPPADPEIQNAINRQLLGKPLPLRIPTQAGHISIPSYFGNPDLRKPLPPLLPPHASNLSSPQTLSEANIVGTTFNAGGAYASNTEVSATDHDPHIKVLEPDLITNLPLFDRIKSTFRNRAPIMTGNIGHSFFRGIFFHQQGDEHKHDMASTGADFYNPHTQGTPHYPDTFENYTAGYKRTKAWLKSSQEIFPEHQHDYTTTFRDYLTQLIRSRRWVKTTQFGSMQIYRDHVAARREERVNELMKGKLFQDLERLRTEKGGLDEIIIYNHKLQFRKQKLKELEDPGHVRRLLIDEKRQEGHKLKDKPGYWRFNHPLDPLRSKDLALSLQNSYGMPLTQIDTTDIAKIENQWLPQHQLDLNQREEMETVLFKERVDQMTEEEKIGLVDKILSEEMAKLEIDDTYYKDWADFPSLQDYRTVYNRYYADVENQELSDIYKRSSGGLPDYFGKQILELDHIYKQYKTKQEQKRKMEELTEQEYVFKLEQMLKQRKTKQDAANVYFLQQQNAAFLHTPFGAEVYQKRQTRSVLNPEEIIEEEQLKLRHKQDQLEKTGDDEGVRDLVKDRPDIVKHQVTDRGRKYFDTFDVHQIQYPTAPLSFTDFTDVRTRMSLGTTLYGSVIQTPAVHQYHDSLDPSPLPKEASPPHFANYNAMHPDRLGYFITYYDAYRMKQPPESPFREYSIIRPDFFQFLSVYPTYTLDGNFVHTPTKDPFEQAKDPSRPNLFGTKLGKRKTYYLYWFLYGFLRPTVQLYTWAGTYTFLWFQSKIGRFAPEWSEQVDMAGDYSLALNTYIPVLPF